MTNIETETLKLDDALGIDELKVLGRNYVRQLTIATSCNEQTLLLDLCAFLARSHYELRPPTGAIALMGPIIPEMMNCVIMQTPVCLQDLQGARKLLEVSTSKLPVICNGRHLIGFLKDPGDKCCLIRFRRGRVWDIHIGNRMLCLFRDDLPATVGQILDKQSFHDSLANRFGVLPPDALSALWGGLRAAARQPHGTNILITGKAHSEATRLASQGIRIPPTLLTPELTRRLTAIDGTLLVDTEGRAHAIGVILDGFVSNGNWRRGGRYNSAVMYCDGRPDAMIVVASESGTIDIVQDTKSAGGYLGGTYLGLAETVGG